MQITSVSVIGEAGVSALALCAVYCDWVFFMFQSIRYSSPGSGLWDELITRPEESYQLWCFGVCDLETS